MSPTRASIALVALGLLSSAPLAAATCTVPAAHATVQQAVDDATCTTVQLAPQEFAESVLVQRSLTLAGDASGSSTITGSFSAAGAGVVVQVSTLQVTNGCPETLASRNGARITTTAVTSTHSSAAGCAVDPAGGRVFRDGFESGDAHSWTFSRP